MGTYYCHTLLESADTHTALISAMMCPFVELMGYWFHALMLGSLATGLYLKLGTAPASVMLLAGGTWMATTLPPEARTIGAALAALGMFPVIYRAARGDT